MKRKRLLMRMGSRVALIIGLSLCPFILFANRSESKELSEQAQKTVVVKGMVTDAITGEPLIGVSVIEDQTTNGTATDFDGGYSLNVNAGASLKFMFLGYKSQIVAVNEKNVIDIKLEEDIQMLSEVVAIGYGSTRKQDLSMAVSTVKVDEVMKGRSSNLNTLLQGRVPGLTIQSAGGDPLKAGTVSIRGRGSRSGDGILYVVDGVPGAPFNTADVESITVLKDAASAAIYGASVGSGGVIIITTRRAQSGKTKVHLNIFQGVQKVGKIPTVLDAEQYNQVWAKAIAEKAPSSSATLPMVANPSLYPYGNITRTNWLNEVFRAAHQQHYDLSITGGSENMKSLASVSYDKTEGVLLNTYKEVLNAKIMTDFQLTPWIKIGQKASFQYGNGQGNINTTSHEGVLIGAVFYPSSATIYEYDEQSNTIHDKYNNPLYGGTIPKWAASQGVSGYGEIRNPVATLQRLRQNRPSSIIHSATSLELKPFSRLTIKSDFSARLHSSRSEIFTGRVPEIGLIIDDNEREISSVWNSHWLWETTATYSESFYDKHNLSILAGYTMSRENYRWTNTSVSDFIKEDAHSTIFPGGNNWEKKKPDEMIWDESMVSFLGRVGYSFDDRYFVTGSLRRDASSKLQKENNSDLFAAFSGSWKISSESFFEPMKEWVDLFKIRVSWGQVGNVNSVDRYSYNVPLSYTPYPLIYGKNLDQQVFGIYAKTFSNPHLKWETTEQTGVGIDFSLFNKALDITIDYFDKSTKDLIETQRVSTLEGYEESPLANVGKVSNRGWEISFTYNQRVNQVDFNVWGNISSVESKVLNLGNLDFLQHSTLLNGMRPLRSKQGEPWYSYYLVKTDGIFQTQEEIDNYTKEGKKIQPKAVPGDLKFVDFNDDGKINNDDKQYLGSYLPKLTYSFGGGLNFKGFDFNFMFQGISKVQIFNGFKQMGMTGRSVGNNMLADVQKSWNYDKQSGIPRLAIAGDENGNYSTASDFLLESGAYMRLKNVTLGYTLPAHLLNSIGLTGSGVRLYLSGDNLLTFTSYSGFDPEVTNFGLDGGNYPVSRSFRAGLNINF